MSEKVDKTSGFVLNWFGQVSTILWSLGCPDPRSQTVPCDIEGYNQLSEQLVTVWDDSESLSAFRLNALALVFLIPPSILARPSTKLERILQTITLYFERYRPKNHSQMESGEFASREEWSRVR